jgi:hypothetical protein
LPARPGRRCRGRGAVLWESPMGAVLASCRLSTVGQHGSPRTAPHRLVQHSERPSRAPLAVSCARSSPRFAGSVVETHNECVAAPIGPAAPASSPLPTQPQFAGAAAPNHSGATSPPSTHGCINGRCTRSVPCDVRPTQSSRWRQPATGGPREPQRRCHFPGRVPVERRRRRNRLLPRRGGPPRGVAMVSGRAAVNARGR